MKLPLSWLKELIQIDLSHEELEEKLTMLGLEVEGIDPLPLPFEGVVVGKVVECEPHPEAEKLCIAQVSDGEQTAQVVCGAPNCRKGLTTAFARVGAKLGLHDEKPLKIKKAKLRGTESMGMLCATDELELGEKSGGIMELADDLEAGTPLEELYGDTIVEIGLTPNLGHCNSVMGVARELSALTGKSISYPLPEVKESADPITASVSIDALDGCPRYACRMVKDVQIAPSPDWLRQKLEGCGVRSINNVVDIGNLVMMELGHPLHMFDADQLEGNRIEVRFSKPGEKFTTLDEIERTLPDNCVMICDGKRSVAIGGIMGGLNSEVGDSTKNVLIEAAYFDPMHIRRASKKLGLSTESSKRFERGTDPEGLQLALDRAASLLQTLAGGTVCTGTLDEGRTEFPKKELSMRVSRANQLIGIQISAAEMETILNSLEMETHFDGDDTFRVTCPTYRNDLNEEIDLIEEIARLYGYDNIPRTPPKTTISPLAHSPSYLFEKQIRHRLLSEGLQELLTCDLIGPSLLKLLKDKTATQISVSNPTSVEQSVLRPSLLPALLQVAKFNFDHQNPDLAAFEVGHIHFKTDSEERGGYTEVPMAGILLTGNRAPHHWEGSEAPADFFDMKGIVENLLKSEGITEERTRFTHSGHENFHPGRQANLVIDGQDIGVLGEVHPDTLKELDLPNRVYFAEIDLAALYRLRKGGEKMEPLNIFPGSDRDWTLTVRHSLAADQLLNAIGEVPSKLLKHYSVISLYQSDKLGADRKNITVNLMYQSAKKTLSQEAVDREHERLMQGVLAKLGEGVLSS